MKFNRTGFSIAIAFCVLTGVFRTSMAQEVTVVKESSFDDRDFKDQSNVVVKLFYIAMRDKSVDKLKEILDPKYVEQHDLESGFSTETIPVNNVYKIKASPDRKTLLCHVLKNGKQTGVVVLNVVKRGHRLWITPPKPPEGKSNRVTPWLLHANLDAS